jgi:hypothetical protein
MALSKFSYGMSGYAGCARPGEGAKPMTKPKPPPYPKPPRPQPGL